VPGEELDADHGAVSTHSHGPSGAGAPDTTSFVDRNGGGRHTVIEDDTSYVGVAVDDAAVYVTNQFNGTLKSIAR